MANRKPVGKTLRFEVFKRDSFTCQYCGAKSPDVLLELDHIHPVADGGGNEVLNLLTSCVDCNRGKGARLLSDESLLAKQRRTLEELQERREQIEWMMECYRAAKSKEDIEWEALSKHVSAQLTKRVDDGHGWCLENGRVSAGLRKQLKKLGLAHMLEATDTAFEYYSDVDTALSKIVGIAIIKHREQTDPDYAIKSQVLNAAKRRCSYFTDSQARPLIEQARELGANKDELFHIANSCLGWTNWCNKMSSLINRLEMSFTSEVS